MAGYTPNEKRLKMFGAQAQGYAMDRVDMYLDKLEAAYTQLRAAYEQVKNTSAAPASAPTGGGIDPSVFAQQNALARQEIERLQAENNALRAKITELEAHVAQATQAAPQIKEGAIARALVVAQEKSEEILRSAQMEAQGIIAGAHGEIAQLQAEKARLRKQLEGIRFALDGLLREPSIKLAEPEQPKAVETAVAQPAAPAPVGSSPFGFTLQ
ncbi:MAG: DivIVA domain-containing protein [Oscillospiraceae bacterium]|jgi:cell division septum initiation protein DivIVA|nr:DivIVA domain-containing protein [Oscillospiraceae bacterium]